jgi:hypothetical protein
MADVAALTVIHSVSYRLNEPFDREVRQTVSSNMLSQLDIVKSVGYELLPCGDVDAHVARILQWRRGNSYVDLTNIIEASV